jgi:hypothetical protein
VSSGRILYVEKDPSDINTAGIYQEDYCWSDSHNPVLLKIRTNLIPSLGMQGRGLSDINTAGIYKTTTSYLSLLTVISQLGMREVTSDINTTNPGLLSFTSKRTQFHTLCGV